MSDEGKHKGEKRGGGTGTSPSGAVEGGLLLSTMLARGILASRYQRRQVMFFGMLFVMGQAFVGAVVIETYLTGRPLLFAAYWLFCFAAVVFVLLLAVYDLLAVRREAREREFMLRATMSDSIREAIEERKRRGGDDEEA